MCKSPAIQSPRVFRCSCAQVCSCLGAQVWGCFFRRCVYQGARQGTFQFIPRCVQVRSVCSACFRCVLEVCAGSVPWVRALEVCFRQVRVPSMRLRNTSQWCVSAECANGVSVLLLRCERCHPGMEGAPRVRLQCSQDMCCPSVCCPKCGVCVAPARCVLPQPGVCCSWVCVAGVLEVCLTSVLFIFNNNDLGV